MSDHGTEIPVPGVKPLDHTADVGLEIEAPDLPDLFRRGARGLSWLILEERPSDATQQRRVRVSASDLPGLFREWLRELLFWHESDGFSVAEIEIRTLEREDETGGRAVLDAAVRGGPDPGTPVREIKGVTLHGLAVERRDGGWYARVIFDV